MAGGTHEGVFCRFAIPDETVRRGQRGEHDGRQRGWGRGRRGRSVPRTGLADPYPRTGEILPQPLVVLREAAELELGHGLLVRARVHGWV